MSFRKFNPAIAVIVLASALFVGALAAPAARSSGASKPADAAAASNGPAATPTPSPSPTPTPTTLTFSPGQPGSPGTVTTALKISTSRYGPIVVSDEGYVLYMSDSDSQNPPSSVCYNACTKKWIPILTTGKVTLDTSIPASVVGTLNRSDGGTQLTMRGWPLYLFVNDTQPGEINGHNKIQHWQVLGPDGKPIP